MTDDPLASLRAVSYMFSAPPETGHAMARFEIVTPASSTGISIPDITLGFKDGKWTADYEDAGIAWHGESEVTAGAVLALLADRIGLKAVVTLKDEEGGEDATA
jgi:hypothetical protein